MAGRREDEELTEVTFTRCPKCPQTVMTRSVPTRRLIHLPDGSHGWQDWNPVDERPSHRKLSMWSDITAAIVSIRAAEFYLGYMPAKPLESDDEAVRMELEDARIVLGRLADALATEGDC